jgi:tRNA (adenine57-N1/adenine58-N1)-methyltransferase
MIHTPGIVARSNIRLVPENHLGDDPLDIKVCLAANEAAKDLLWGNDRETPHHPRKGDDVVVYDGGAAVNEMSDAVDATTAKNSREREQLSFVDSSLYRERHLPPPPSLIRNGDLVVVFESFNDLNFVYATPGEIFSNRNGHFHHDDFIGRPYGCKIRSRNDRGLGFLYLLRPTPELWTRSLPHRTQIVHELDASMIVHYLDIGPNMVVCESGTGSGAMSHAILRSIAPLGKLHTYEFNRMRAEKARMEFVGHGLGHLVDVHHRDVCGKMALSRSKKGGEEEDGATMAGGDGADDSDNVDNCDVNNVDGNGEDDGRGGFQLGPSIAHAIFLDLPEPWLAVPHAAHVIRPNGKICSYSPCVEQTQRTVAAMRQHGFHSLRTVEARLREFFVSEVEMEAPPCNSPPDVLTEERASMERERCANGGVLPAKIKIGVAEERDATAGGGGDKAVENIAGGSKRRRANKKILCARPFAQMRGHTAFLTFATAGNAPRPDPNENVVRG